MSDKFNDLWVEKYRPTKIEDYIFDDDSHKVAFTKFIESRSIPHLLLTGVQGSGKTSIANILINSMGVDDADLLYINASDENSVDVMRDKIKNFVSTYGFGDTDFKIVLLEEADYMTHNSQSVLRRLMEDYASDARFILTANHENKIVPAIKSRCQHFVFKASDKDDIALYIATILEQESIKFSLDDLDMYIRATYPDIRKTLNLVQQSIESGKLRKASGAAAATSDFNISLLDLISSDKWLDARKLVCANILNDQFEELYRFLYLNLEKSKKFSKQENWEAGQIEIAEHLYMHAIVADPEINLSALFIKLKQV